MRRGTEGHENVNDSNSGSYPGAISIAPDERDKVPQNQESQQEEQEQRPLEPTPPDDLLCPITQEIFIHPVQDIVWGKTYERSAILAWLAAKGTCPLTRRPMRPWELMTNQIMMEKVDCWRRQNGQVLPLLVPRSSVGSGLDYDDSLHHHHQPQWKGLTGIVGYISISPSPEAAETLNDNLPPPLPHPKDWFCHKKTVTTPTLDALLDDYEEMMIEIELLEKQQQERNKLHGHGRGVLGGGGKAHEGDNTETKTTHEGRRALPMLYQVEEEEGWWHHPEKPPSRSTNNNAQKGEHHHYRDPQHHPDGGAREHSAAVHCV